MALPSVAPQLRSPNGRKASPLPRQQTDCNTKELKDACLVKIDHSIRGSRVGMQTIDVNWGQVPNALADCCLIFFFPTIPMTIRLRTKHSSMWIMCSESKRVYRHSVALNYPGSMGALYSKPEQL